MKPKFTTGAELLGSWLADVERGEPPKRYALGAPFDALDLRPGRALVFGGAPGTGKSAALVQMGVDLLRMNDGARLLVANVEMVPELLIERAASRLSGVPLSAISDRTLSAEQLARVRVATDSLRTVAGRLAFLQAPFALEHIAAAGTAFGANVLVLDYLQRFTVGKGGQSQREQLETACEKVRRFCDAGAAVLAAVAVARQKNERGSSSYKGLNLASLRGSSELEYGADAVYLFAPEDGAIVLECAKNRYGPTTDVRASFDPTTQTFVPLVEASGFAGFDTAKPAQPHKPKGV
jgi:replicative DNA helicase